MFNLPLSHVLRSESVNGVIISTYGNVKLYLVPDTELNPLAVALRAHCAYLLESGQMEIFPEDDTAFIRTLEDYYGSDLVCEQVNTVSVLSEF